MKKRYNLYNGDCLEVMQKLISKDIKVDMILTDLPYGTTVCKWDNIIPFEPMWENLHKLVHEYTPILLFGSEPFSSCLRNSNLQEYKYDLIWSKGYGTNFLNANRMPLQSHEIISIFYKKLPCYNPQKKYVGIKHDKPITGKKTNQVYNQLKQRTPYVDDGYRYPLSIIKYPNNKGETSNSKRLHPTQKPVGLLEYLIKTYSNENDIILDFTMGSGSTGVACLNTNRRFIGIELDTDYFEIAKNRLNEANKQKKLNLE